MKRSRSFVSSLLRAAVLTTGLALSCVAVVASCSSSPKAHSALSCPVRSDVARCSGNDPTFVFFPPLTCAGGSVDDAGVPDDAGSGDTSSNDTGSDDASSDDAGSGDTSSNDTSSNDTSSDDTSSNDTSSDDASSNDTGSNDEAIAGDEVGVTSDADEAGGASPADAAPNPCRLVTTLDVFFTPQACQAFVGAESSRAVANGSDPSAPVIVDPADGDMLTPDNWSIFDWELPKRDSRRDWLKRAVDLVEPSAYAYSPLRGDAYVLEFTQGCTEILRVMLAEQLWVPDPASWALLTSLTGPVQVRVYWMRFAGDTLVSKPVSSAPITITMQLHPGD